MGRYIITPKDELMHYGVKGMKWGVRKDRETHGIRKLKRKRSGSAQSEQDRIIEDLQGRYIRIGLAKIRVRDMMTPKEKMIEAIQNWSEAQDGKIRDSYDSGKITKKQADKEWGRLAKETERMLKEAESRYIQNKRIQRYVNNNPLMTTKVTQATSQHLSFHQQAVQQHLNQQFMQESITAANRNASLGLSGGMNPFMFG